MNFYNNNITQTAIVAFLNWFSKLSIEKYATVSVSGTSMFVQRKVIPVPICWATREKFVEILRSSSARKAFDPALRDKNPVEMQWILPRISVNQTGMTYDSARRLVKTNKIQDSNTSGTSRNSVYSPTPYNIDLEVCTISRNIDENFQLMEQIIPFFSPTMNLSLNMGSITDSESIPITLNSVTLDNPTDIPENDERIFTNTYNFTMKLNYYIPKKNSSIINKVSSRLIDNTDIFQIDVEYAANLHKVTTSFSEYVNNTGLANPFVQNTSSSSSNILIDGDTGNTLYDSITGDTLVVG